MSNRKAFTLVEVLVSVTIISLLMALAMPQFVKAKENAKQVACMANLHQIGLITQMYLESNEMYYPDFFFDFGPGNSNTIVVLIQPKKAATTGLGMYNEKLMVCPRDDYPSEMPVIDAQDNITWRPMSYGFNIEVDIFKVKGPKIKHPSRFGIFYDGMMGKSTTMTDGGSGKLQGHFFGTDDFVQKSVRYRHLVRPDQANMLFADYHVEPVTQITTDMISLNPDYVHNPGGGGSGGGGGGNGGGGGKKK